MPSIQAQSFVASLNWQNSANPAADQRANEAGPVPWPLRHWTWTPEAISPHAPPEALTTLSEPGWPRAPNDLLQKTLRVLEQPTQGRVMFLGSQRSEVLQEGISIVARAGVGIGIFVYMLAGAPSPNINTEDEVQVAKKRQLKSNSTRKKVAKVRNARC